MSGGEMAGLAIVLIGIVAMILYRTGGLPPGARAPGAIVAGFYNACTRWAFTKRMLWVLLALVVAIALLYGLSVHQWDPQVLAQDEWHGVLYWVLAIAVASAVAAVWLGKKRKILSLLATTALIIFIIAVYASYRDGWLTEGYRNTFYVLVSAAAVLAATYATTDREKLGAAVGIGAIFLMLGCNSEGVPWAQFSRPLPWYWGSDPVAAKCPGVAPTSGEELGADEWKTFNPDGCDTQFVVTRGTVLAKGPGLQKPVRVSADNVVPNKENNAYAVYTEAKAEGGTAVWWYIKCPKGTMIIGKWECRRT